MPRKGYRPTEEHRRKLSLARAKRVGSLNPMWKGGRIKANGEGYMMILMPEHPNADKRGYILEHRYFMEQKIGRFLTTEEEVDHINGIKDDNRIENLRLFKNHSDHMKEEGRRGRMRKSEETRKTMSEIAKISQRNRSRDSLGHFI